MLTSRSGGPSVIVQRDEGRCWETIWEIPAQMSQQELHMEKTEGHGYPKEMPRMRSTTSGRSMLRALLLAVGLLLMTPWALAAADWPQWLGPSSDGVSTENSGWPKGWPPERLWGRNVGAGCTSPIMAGGRTGLGRDILLYLPVIDC